MEKNSKIHSEIALEIKAAKKRMFRRHREGLDLGEAILRFKEEITQRMMKFMPETPAEFVENFQRKMNKALEADYVELHGDAAATTKGYVHPDWLRLADAIEEIATNKRTP